MPLLRVLHDDQTTEINVETGANLRRTLLDHGISPYTAITRIANCGGNGICATCGVWIESNEPAPQHWHDKMANRFGYPRLSCQIAIDEDMTVRILDDKLIWGGRDPQRANKLAP
jgi:ferredoxin